MSHLFVSDLHLSAERPDQVESFRRFLEYAARTESTLYVLGDLFEVWLGDDDDTPPHDTILDALAAFAARRPWYFLRGNRDFLVGDVFSERTGGKVLDDHTVVDVDGTPTLLMHGDLLCTRDIKYQKFREFVRNPETQAKFLAQPLAMRRLIARQTRSDTMASMVEKDDFIMDAEQDSVERTMREHGVHRLIHGHTHRPAAHRFELDGATAVRYVLNDWYDADGLLLINPGQEPRHMTVSEFISA